MDLLIWGLICIALVVAEGFTMQLVSIWFAAGALAAFFVTLFGGNGVTQLAVFVAVSALLLAVTRPILRKITVKKVTATNADRDIGMTATVLEEIDNDKGTGRASRNGVDWIAISETGEVIPAGTIVVIRLVQGTKLVVVPELKKQSVELTH